MSIFAWRNLLTRPLRTILALIGLSIPILGVLGLFSVSNGMRNLVGDTLSQIEGVMILRENALSPVFSDLPARIADELRALPSVRASAPEVWRIAPNVEGRSMVTGAVSGLVSGKGSLSIFEQPVISGQDIEHHLGLRSAVFPRAMKEGRYIRPDDRGKPSIVISRKLSRDFPTREGKPRGLGDTLTIGGKPFEVVGIYETGSMLLDVVIVMDIDTARSLLNVSKDVVSCVYVEGRDPTGYERLTAEIEEKFERVDARSMDEVKANFGNLMGQLDKLLLLTVSLAMLVGIVGIVNTMLMSTTERFTEFGVLRTNGWSEVNILTLVTLESAYLGLLSGLLGCGLAYVLTAAANQVVTGGIHLTVSPWLLGLGIGLSVVMGTLGGLYPAWRAARMVPMEAIRLGSH